MHRPLALRKISSLHSSRNSGPESGKTASKPLICIGVGTEASKRIFFAHEAGPPYCTKTKHDLHSVFPTECTKRVGLSARGRCDLSRERELRRLLPR